MFKYDENVEARYGIKLVNDRRVRKEAAFSRRTSLEWIRKLTNHLIANPDPMVVPVYSFEVLEELEESRGNWGTYRYAYEMMRLPMLSNDEKNVINHVIRFYRPVTRDENHPDIQRAWREFPKLVEFLNRVVADDYYTDRHDNNFLKDEEGNYRIIDLEGFARYPGLGDAHR